MIPDEETATLDALDTIANPDRYRLLKDMVKRARENDEPLLARYELYSVDDAAELLDEDRQTARHHLDKLEQAYLIRQTDNSDYGTKYFARGGAFDIIDAMDDFSTNIRRESLFRIRTRGWPPEVEDSQA